jgi:glucose-6-phosphate isomerase
MLRSMLETHGLHEDARRLRMSPLRDLARTPGRSESMVLNACDLSVDLSRHLIDPPALGKLLRIAKELGFDQHRQALFSGGRINLTENRSALHTALRAPQSSIPASVRSDILDCRQRMESLCQAVISGSLTGATGQLFTDVISIGIGGSDLGPRMATTALRRSRTRLAVHFVSNVDPDDILQALQRCEPASTLVIVSSKTFTTQETLLNADVARQWIASAMGEHAINSHFAAVSTALDKAVAFGIHPDRVLPMWDWVGGRYSVWSAIGLPLMLAVGPEAFGQFLTGAHQMDEHFLTAEPEANAPLVMGALAVWYRNVLGAQTHGVIAYEQRLELFVDHLQQLDMESLGKRVDRDGCPVDIDTGGVIWGGVGTNTQHSFHQLLHQGTSIHPVDLLVGLRTDSDLEEQHACLLANCLAQSSALLEGCSPLNDKGVADTHRMIPGGKPHGLIVYPALTPAVLGQLIALYEHRVFTQSVFWRINPFDQYGVELGKTIGKKVLQALLSPDDMWPSVAEDLMADFDPALQAIIRRYREQKR